MRWPLVAAGGTPFSIRSIHAIQRSGPRNLQKTAAPRSACTASFGRRLLMYLNYKPAPLDNISYRAEFVDDYQGQRTGTKTRYIETGIGWQHWFSATRSRIAQPEVSYYWAMDAFAFNGNVQNLGIREHPGSTRPSSRLRPTSSFTSDAWKDRGGSRARQTFHRNSSTGDNNEANSFHLRLARSAGPGRRRLWGADLPVDEGRAGTGVTGL